jgi:hypothetical protein
VFSIAALIAPSILCLLWFDFDLFKTLPIAKILLLAVSIGLTVSAASAGAALVAIETNARGKTTSDAMAVVTILSIGMFVQFLAMGCTGAFVAIMRFANREFPWHSLASVGFLAFAMATSSSLYAVLTHRDTLKDKQ